MEQDVVQSNRSQNIALIMVIFGTVALFVGCHFRFAELSTSAAGITGAGINMLTTQFRSAAKSGNASSGGAVEANFDVGK